MQFLKKEVEGEERISLAVAGFGLGKNQECKSLKEKQFSLENLKNKLTYWDDSCEVIDILIGAYLMRKMLTGRRKVLSSGLVAVETYLGWTLMGKVPQEEPSEENLAMTVLSLFVNEAEIFNL
ncbi:uncharacterized protein TNCV_3279121 [Trichonephila clavipes]|nr:uncharacterized protein TNCV_3279121 [Trichonephila clavipes]